MSAIHGHTFRRADSRPPAKQRIVRRLRAGKTLGEYRLLFLLNHHKPSLVFKAEHKPSGRQVALKFNYSDNSDRRRLLINEALLLEELEDANVGRGVPRVIDFAFFADATAIAMEFIEGDTLFQRIKRGDLSPREIFDVGAQVCWILGGVTLATSRRGRPVSHYDIGPSNIIIGPQGFVSVTDFGYAVIERSGLRVPDYFFGTPRYASPEGAHGGTVDYRSDIFSLGAVLVEALTGKLPPRLGPKDTFPPNLYDAFGPVPRAYGGEALLRRMLERGPEKRPDDLICTASDLWELSVNSAG